MKLQRQTVAIVAGVLALGYFVILGEAGQREPHLIVRVVNAAAAGTLIVVYLVTAPSRADRVDRGILLGLLFFAGAAILAQFPRQAFDAMLAALLYAAAFFVARTLLTLEAGRVAFIRCLMVLSALLTFGTAERWLLSALEWWSLAGWSVIPPLDLNLPANPWGHRHDLTLLLVMLYPSWWIGRIGPLRAAAATVVGLLTLLIVLVDGSRTVWLGIAIASAALFVPVVARRWPKELGRRVGIGVVVLVGAVAMVLSGVGAPILQRLLTAASIEPRLAMWGSLTDAWLSKPVAGYGPGSFVWVLQQTRYFDTNSLAPRHPDNAIFQILPEAGLLGAAALIVIGVILLPAIFRGRSRASRWVAITFAVAALGANSTVFGFLVAVAIGWVAFAIPRVPAGRQLTAPVVGRRIGTLASLACFAIVGVAWTATAAADVSYLSARSAIEEGRIDEARPQLELARSLDPGMALYVRQLGTAQLLTGDPSAAIRNLEDAARMNPSDDLALRSLALAYAAAGDAHAAWTAVESATQTQRSDPTNLLLGARWQVENGHYEEAVGALGEVVQAWPEIVAAPGWREILPPTISTLDVIEVALARWSRDLPSPEPRSLQPWLLAVMAGRTDIASEVAEATLDHTMGTAYVAVMACDPRAPRYLEEVPNQLRRTALYWSLVVRQSALEGRNDDRAARLLQIMTNGALLSADTDETLNPLNENGHGGYSADIWGYRRSPITWPDYESLPSWKAGITQWVLEPRKAVHSAGLDPVMRACR